MLNELLLNILVEPLLDQFELEDSNKSDSFDTPLNMSFNPVLVEKLKLGLL